jgi:oligopeptide/dipeptide ABC transporter ATP-binding protein
MIAMALACSPTLLILDEPTTALDMTVQAQILELLVRLKSELSMSVLLIAHDLALVSEMADEIVVLYAGTVVERGPTQAVLNAPGHPYTRALLRSIPPEGEAAYRVRQKGRRLPAIQGTLPDLRHLPYGCLFRDRCDEAFDRCAQAIPSLVPVPGRGSVRCFLVEPAEISAREGGGFR